MPRLVPRSGEGRAAAAVVAVFVVLVLLGVIHRLAVAAPYTNPFWSNASSSAESAVPHVADLAMVQEGNKCRSDSCGEFRVDVRTGELFWDHFMFDTRGVEGDHVFALRWRSMISGSTQVGRQMLPSWETTVKYVVLVPLNPTGNGGHRVDVRRPSGRIDAFTWNGTAYVAPSGVFDTLTTNGSGNYVLTTKQGFSKTFDANGMPAADDTPNGNTDTWTYNSSYQWTGLTDDRGKTYSISSNGSGYITSITDPASRTWTLGYSLADNLTTITTPATADQTSGITTTLGYDGQNRLTSVTDGRGNTVWAIAYVSTSNQVASITIDGDTVSYSYSSGLTTRTDRNGNVHRYYHSGQQITSADMLVASASKYLTTYTYSGVNVSNVVLPRGNRIDFTFDSMNNLTERRHRISNTGTNLSTDIVHGWGYNSSNWMTGYTDPLGNAYTLSRDSAGNLTGVTNPTVTNPSSQSSSVSMTYNGSGQITQYTDEEGTSTAYTYFTSGTSAFLLEKVEVNPTGLDLETVYSYDSKGDVATVTDPRGNVWTQTTDTIRRLKETQAPSPLSHKVKIEYDGNGNMTKRETENRDKDGNQVTANPWFTETFTYSNTDDLLTHVEEIDASTTRTTTREYDSNQNLVRVIKPEGNKEKWEHDERDLVIAHIRGETASRESEEAFVYDLNGNRITHTDGRGKDTGFTFDMFDRRTRETNALGHYTEYELDKNGNVTKIQRKDSSNNELQRSTRFFDERNRLWKTSDLFKDPSATHSDAVTTFARLKTGQVASVTNPRGKTSSRDYDAAHRLVESTDPMGNEVGYTLDANGNATAWYVKEIDAITSVIHGYEATWDAANRKTSQVEIDRTNSSNRYTTWFYHDSRSNMVFMKNAEGNPTRWTIDGVGRMIKIERALTLGSTIDDFTTAQVTEYGFDKNDRMTSHKDDGTNVSSWAFDALDRPVSLTYPDSSAALYEYDLAHNVVETTDPAGNVIEDTFDDLNRNTGRSVSLVSGFLGTTAESRTFDALDRITENADNDYKVENTYAVIGLRSFVYAETQSYVGGTANAKTVTKTYDANGNRVTEAYPSGSGMSLSMNYNDIDGLTSIYDGTNTVASYTWIGRRRKGTTFQSGATRTNLYTGFREEIESVRHETSGSSTILRLDYGYDKNHDRLFERFGSSGSAGDAFAYDKLRRLVNAWMGSSTPSSPVGNPYVKKIDYNYDDDGNRTSVVGTPYGGSPGTTSYSTNSLYQYTSVGGTSHSHDGNGNLADNGVLKFKYNYKNLIGEVRLKSDNSLVASYKYDAEGRRVEKAVSGGITERYLRSRAREEEGSHRLANNPGKGGTYDMSHVVAVFDGSNNWKQNFVWDDGIDGIEMLEQKDVLDYDTDGNTTEVTRSFYHRNALGSVMEITDANQAAVVSYRYDPYGKVTITRGGSPQSTDPLGQHWTFTGRFLDEESGLYYYRARYYDPGTGRFLERDPLGHAGAPCLYELCSSSPLARLDPSGLDDDLKRAIERYLADPGSVSPKTEPPPPDPVPTAGPPPFSGWGEQFEGLGLDLDDMRRRAELWDPFRRRKWGDDEPSGSGGVPDPPRGIEPLPVPIPMPRPGGWPFLPETDYGVPGEDFGGGMSGFRRRLLQAITGWDGGITINGRRIRLGGDVSTKGVFVEVSIDF